jgi:hypothetical protein
MYEDVVVDDAAEGADTGGPVLSFFDGDQRRDARMSPKEGTSTRSRSWPSP